MILFRSSGSALTTGICHFSTFSLFYNKFCSGRAEELLITDGGVGRGIFGFSHFAALKVSSGIVGLGLSVVSPSHMSPVELPRCFWRSSLIFIRPSSIFFFRSICFSSFGGYCFTSFFGWTDEGRSGFLTSGALCCCCCCSALFLKFGLTKAFISCSSSMAGSDCLTLFWLEGRYFVGCCSCL